MSVFAASPRPPIRTTSISQSDNLEALVRDRKKAVAAPPRPQRAAPTPPPASRVASRLSLGRRKRPAAVAMTDSSNIDSGVEAGKEAGSGEPLKRRRTMDRKKMLRAPLSPVTNTKHPAGSSGAQRSRKGKASKGGKGGKQTLAVPRSTVGDSLTIANANLRKSVRMRIEAARHRVGDKAARKEKALSSLKAWRAERSKTLKQPEYVIFHDKVLDRIAEELPSTMAQLLRVQGVHPLKAFQYGQHALEVVRSVRTSTKLQCPTSIWETCKCRKGLLVLRGTRKAESNGEVYYACSRYPACRVQRNPDGSSRLLAMINPARLIPSKLLP